MCKVQFSQTSEKHGECVPWLFQQKGGRPRTPTSSLHGIDTQYVLRLVLSMGWEGAATLERLSARKWEDALGGFDAWCCQHEAGLHETVACSYGWITGRLKNGGWDHRSVCYNLHLVLTLNIQNEFVISSNDAYSILAYRKWNCFVKYTTQRTSVICYPCIMI